MPRLIIAHCQWSSVLASTFKWGSVELTSRTCCSTEIVEDFSLMFIWISKSLFEHGLIHITEFDSTIEFTRSTSAYEGWSSPEIDTPQKRCCSINLACFSAAGNFLVPSKPFSPAIWDLRCATTRVEASKWSLLTFAYSAILSAAPPLSWVQKAVNSGSDGCCSHKQMQVVRNLSVHCLSLSALSCLSHQYGHSGHRKTLLNQEPWSTMLLSPTPSAHCDQEFSLSQKMLATSRDAVATYTTCPL